jgi:hypothetical protein
MSATSPLYSNSLLSMAANYKPLASNYRLTGKKPTTSLTRESSYTDFGHLKLSSASRTQPSYSERHLSPKLVPGKIEKLEDIWIDVKVFQCLFDKMNVASIFVSTI